MEIRKENIMSLRNLTFTPKQTEHIHSTIREQLFDVNDLLESEGLTGMDTQFLTEHRIMLKQILSQLEKKL
jgi:hypothetical protein